MSADPVRFWAKVDRTAGPTACWYWQGAKNEGGYGQYRFPGPRLGYVLRVVAHRVAYEMVNGPVPAGLQLDHLCRNRNCCNPLHLEPVTASVNSRRGAKGSATHCPRGHAYDEKNTRIYQGRRHCRACHRIYSREYRARLVAS